MSSIESFAGLIGLSAIVSGLVSTFINYLINIREFKKKAKLEIIKEKTALFSYVLFQLDRMKFMANAIKKTPGHVEDNVEDYAYSGKEGQVIFENITKAMEVKYYLLKQEILSQWMEVSTLFFQPEGLVSIRKLRTSLIEEYNTEIIDKYQKMTGIKLEKKT